MGVPQSESQSESVSAGGYQAAAAYGSGLLVSISIWLVLRWLQGPGLFPYDDSYITLHAAQSLNRGYDPNFPGVSPLFGSTSAPFLALVSLLMHVLRPLAALSFACWLGIAAYTLALVHLCRGLRLKVLESAGIVFLGIAVGTVPMHLLNGLETSWTLAAITWTLALASGGSDGAAAMAAGIVGSVRPEMGLFALCTVAALCVRRGVSWRRTASLIALAAWPLVIVSAWYLHDTGDPFPMTGIAKRYFFAEGQEPLSERMKGVGSALLSFALSCGIVALAPLRTLRSALGRATLVFVVLLLALAQTLPGSIGWNFSRYLAPLVPVMVWASARRLAIASGSARRLERAFVIACVAWTAVLIPAKMRTYRTYIADKQRGLVEQGAWCRDHLPPGSVLLVHDVGYISYATDFRLVDMVGLKTPEAIAINREITWPSGGENRVLAIARIAREQHATHMVLLKGWLDMDEVPDQLRELGWTVEPLSIGGAYRVFRISPVR